MENIHIQGLPETMLQTLYARAMESQKEPRYIYDEKAIEIVSSLDYDFSSAHRDAAMRSGVLARTIVLDKMVTEYLAACPGAVVVNIACGLDTRCYRMAGFCRWYNLDLPETMEIRRRFLPETGPIYQIAKSAMDESWGADIRQTDEPVLILIEGLSMYLCEADIRQIFSIIKNRFAHATVFLETMSPFVAKHVREKSIEKSRASFSWGVKNGKALQALLPDFQSLQDVSLTEGMKVFSPAYHVLGRIGCIRNLSNKILVLRR